MRERISLRRPAFCVAAMPQHDPLLEGKVNHIHSGLAVSRRWQHDRQGKRGFWCIETKKNLFAAAAAVRVVIMSASAGFANANGRADPD